MCKDDEDDNVYISTEIAQEVIDALNDYYKTIPKECQCGSQYFTFEDGKFTCSNCGLTFDQVRESEEPPEKSSS